MPSAGLIWSTLLVYGHSYIELSHLIENINNNEIVRINSKFFFCYFSLPIITILVSMFFFITFGDYAVAGQKPPTVSTVNFSAPDSSNLTTSTTDVIGITMNSIRADNMDKLMNQTIAPFINNSTSQITTISESSANEEREINQPILATNSSEIIADTNSQDEKSPMEDYSSKVDNSIPFTSNQTVLLRFQDPPNYDIINKLDGIENLINEQISVENVTETVTQSVQESNNKMVQDLSQIKTSINRGLAASNNLTSIQTSKNEITQDLSQLKSSINTPPSWSSYLSRAAISGIVAAIVSALVILLLIRTYKTHIGIRFNELMFKGKYR